MKQMLFVFTVITFLYCDFSSAQRRISNSETAKENEFPYMAIVQAGSTTCGGALISDEFVITAAHCLMNLNGNQRKRIIFGINNYYKADDEPQRVEFKNYKYWIHENFTMPSATNDIALIQTPEKIKFSQKVQPLKLSCDERIDGNGKEVSAVISGWGLDENYHPPSVLKKAIMTLISIKDCYKYQPHFVEKITAHHICAFGKKSSGKIDVVSPCDGDSGSPLVAIDTRELIGITSYVKDAEDGIPTRNVCESDQAPAVYVRVTSYHDWIKEKSGIRFC
ncbi:CLUMA_CG011932, isoform A [Clunio marinus]|uniref:CLUMA_CG011932, isoform A n=1 Tax=Clunio marinus TaxID=568069 RepID=A0A1J1IEL6_9DIPT|nr:CLUMA_CG011932, isoform A [Clunio marinus]